MENYNASQIRTLVEADIDSLFAPWAANRQPGWTPDPATKILVALGYWVDKELAQLCSDEDRRTQLWKYNRLSRTYDVFEVAAEVMNDALSGNIEKNRRGHRRWG